MANKFTCPGCTAPMPRDLARGTTHYECKYCGTVVEVPTSYWVVITETRRSACPSVGIHIGGNVRGSIISTGNNNVVQVAIADVRGGQINIAGGDIVGDIVDEL